MAKKQNINWDWFGFKESKNADESTYYILSDGIWRKSILTNPPTNRMIYEEYYCNGKTTKFEYDTNGVTTSIETIYNGYVSKQTLKDGKWQEVRKKRNDGTNIKYNSKGELIHYEDNHGNYWDKQEMPGILICPFDEKDDFFIRNGIIMVESFDKNGDINYYEIERWLKT